MMAAYQLTAIGDVIRTADGARIPNDATNPDWQDYLNWLALGNSPDPYVAPQKPVPELPPEAYVLYDHENRLRAIEGQPPLSINEFLAMVGR